MSVREIQPSSNVPALRLPPGALSPEDRQYEHDVATDPSAIEPIEHKLRVDLMAAGIPESKRQLLNNYSHYRAGPDDDDPWLTKDWERPFAVQCVERTIHRQWDSEERYFEEYESDAVLADAPAYLEHQLREARSSSNPEAAVETERENRKKWYALMPWKNLYPVFKQSSVGELIEHHHRWPAKGEPLHGEPNHPTFVGVLVIPNDLDEKTAADQYGVDQAYVYNEREFASRGDTELRTPTDYGIELPAPLLMGEYPSGSKYLFIPWSSGLVCQGPFKDKPYRVLCKHEAYAAFTLSQQDGIFLPVDEGIDIPARARRFIDPRTATSHTPEA